MLIESHDPELRAGPVAFAETLRAISQPMLIVTAALSAIFGFVYLFTN